MLTPGEKIGRFVVVTELGSGGMGAVYRAHDPQLDRQVALKVMRNATGEEEDRVRMLREGQAMARVTHPNVITVYEVGTEGGMVFLAQELLDAGTLGEWLKKPRERNAIIDKFIAAGRGLAAAHAAELVHRDFKPDNVLLGKDGRVRVADFGLARTATALGDALAATQRGGGPRVETDPMASPMSALTRTGTVMGTPMFMAPEQHKGERADARSDQFAFCVSLYHALYGAWPYDGKTAPALADAVIEGRLAPPPKNVDVPARLRKILLRGLATEPAARYPTMQALLAELEHAVRPPTRSRAPVVVGALVLLLAAGGATAYVLLSKQDPSKAPPVVAPTPTLPTDITPPTADDGIGWLTTAIDKGQFRNAIEKLDLAVGIAARDNKPAQAAIAQAAGVYMRVLRAEPSDLENIDGKIEQATKQAAGDPLATGYIDLAEAALALARGQLPAARERSKKCATSLATPAPVLAATCYQIHGDAQASLGDPAAARSAYEAGLAIGKDTPEVTSTLQLALAQLELDGQHPDVAAEIATKVLAECTDRAAIGCEVYARILLSRVRLLQDTNDRQAAQELLGAVKPKQIEAFAVRMAHAIALGQVHGYMGEAGEDGILGLDRIENARAQAEGQGKGNGLVGLGLEARLARVRILLIQSADDAEREVNELAKLARAKQFERIARLAEASLAELADEPRDMLPADGGLPAVRTGSSGSP
jgi:serine/threonine protein kinase